MLGSEANQEVEGIACETKKISVFILGQMCINVVVVFSFYLGK